MPRPDRRRERTQTALREALVALILERGYETTTVQDIVDRANLGRATFYLHFPNGKDELLLHIMDVAQKDILKRAHTHGLPRIPSIHAFQHAAENASLYRAILSGGGMKGIMTRFQQSTAAEVLERLKLFIPVEQQANAPLEMIAAYVTGALNATVVWWLENDQPYPPEEMALRFLKMTQAAVESLLSASASP